MHRWPRLLAATVANGCIGLLLSALIGLATWYATGGRVFSVQTASMTPTYRPGDAIIDRQLRFADLRVGQIVSYRSPASKLVIISHRIIAIDRSRESLQTKGDNLSQADLPVPSKQVIGQVTAVAPHLGTALHWLRRPAGLTLVVYLPAAIAVIAEINRLWWTPRTGYYRLQNR